MTAQWAASDRALTAGTDAPARRPHPAVAESRKAMSLEHNATRTLAASLATAAPPSPFKPVSRSSAMRHRLRPLLVCAALAAPAAGPAAALAAGPATETVYIQGDTAEINTGAAVIFDASAGVLQAAPPIYIIEFPVAPGTTGPITLPSGYRPQHNGFPPSPIPYHDHVLISAPGLATSATAGEYMAPLRVVPMRYSQ